MPFGKVKSWSKTTGYGFILGASPDPSSNQPADYFVHFSELRVNPGNDGRRELKPGAHVQFTPVRHGGGLRAKDVRYVEEEILTLPAPAAKAGQR